MSTGGKNNTAKIEGLPRPFFFSEDRGRQSMSQFVISSQKT